MDWASNGFTLSRSKGDRALKVIATFASEPKLQIRPV